MQSVSSKIWTRVTVSISYDDNHYLHDNELLLVHKYKPYLPSGKLLPRAGLGHTLVSRVGRYSDLAGLVLASQVVGWGASRPASSSLREAFPQALTHLGGARFIARRLRLPFLGKCRRDQRLFGAVRRVRVTALRPDQPSKVLMPRPSAWWDVRQIPTSFQQSNLTVSNGHF